MRSERRAARPSSVAPLAGAWIEIIADTAGELGFPESHPSRVRGLKFVRVRNVHESADVAPLAGAWIEIAPPAVSNLFSTVAPLAGAWIEIPIPISPITRILGRTPRGCVD